jgi:benzoyl-CoA reductase subunit C
LKEKGKKVISYFCVFTPLEFLTALDIVPYRIFGSLREPVTLADAHLEPFMCPFVRSCLDLVLKGEYEFVDGIVVPHTCDNIEKTYSIWKFLSKFPFCHYLDIPHMLFASSLDFFKEELIRLKRSLESFAGRTISSEQLVQAIQTCNETRYLLRELYEVRKEEPPRISGVEVTKLMVAGLSIPVAEWNELLVQVIQETKKRKERPAKRTRVLVWGSEIDDIALIQLIEDCGANVVVDDLCTGTRLFHNVVTITNDPLDGLARFYLYGNRCSRTYRNSGGGTWEEDLENRFGYILKYAKEFNVNGVILYTIRFCDSFELDAPVLTRYLQDAGLKVLRIEDDYSMRAVGQLRTRIQAFLEIID